MAERSTPPPIGIDLGAANPCVGVWWNGRVHFIPNQQRNKTNPFERQAPTNLCNRFSRSKRFGRTHGSAFFRVDKSKFSARTTVSQVCPLCSAPIESCEAVAWKEIQQQKRPKRHGALTFRGFSRPRPSCFHPSRAQSAKRGGRLGSSRRASGVEINEKK